MRELLGVVFFLGTTLLAAAWRWPDDPQFLQLLPPTAVSFAAMLSPLFATWVMPTRLSLVTFPIAVVGLYIGAGHIGAAIFPPPDTYICGLPFFGMFVGTVGGLALGIFGRWLGLVFGGDLKSGPLTYLVQILPFGLVAALIAMATR